MGNALELNNCDVIFQFSQIKKNESQKPQICVVACVLVSHFEKLPLYRSHLIEHVPFYFQTWMTVRAWSGLGRTAVKQWTLVDLPPKETNAKLCT